MAMNCETFKQQIDAYLDGELMLDERCDMEMHAAECEDCAQLLEQATALSGLCAELDDEVAVPLSAQAAWRRAIRAEAAQKKKPSNGWIRSLGTIAAALLLAVIGTHGMRASDSLPVIGNQTDYVLMNESSAETVPERDERMSVGMTPMNGFVLTGSTLHSDGSVTEDDSRASDTLKSENTQAQTTIVVLRSAERKIQSDGYDMDVQWLEDLVSEYGAYFEERTETVIEDGVTGRVVHAVVRVPSERLDDFLMELDQLGNTVVKSEKAEDVTGRCMDTQSRLNALKVQKAKLDEMLASATDVSELIAIDEKMTEVIGSIEALEGDLRRWESQQSYSKVVITLTEVFRKQMAPTASLGERMKNGFDESVVWLGEFGQDVLVMLASAAPKMVIWVPAAALIVVLICVIVKKRRK